MWIGIATLVLGCVVTAEVGRRARRGALPRNHMAGIRTPATLADDEAWARAHREAGSVLQGTGVAGVVLGLATAVVAATGAGDAVVAGLLVAVAAVLLAGVLWACVRGDRAARWETTEVDL